MLVYTTRQICQYYKIIQKTCQTLKIVTNKGLFGLYLPYMPLTIQQIIGVALVILAAVASFFIVERKNRVDVNNVPLTVAEAPTDEALSPATSSPQDSVEIENEPATETVTLPPSPEPAQSTPPPPAVTPPENAPAATLPPTVETPTVSFNDINTSTREAVVNILCTIKSTGSFKPISGSGVIIDDRGVILTNAHIAQYFLLKDYQIPDFVTCTIRTESPAQPAYRAELLYISPEWITENANNISEENPQGTGENDYALLRITEHVNSEKTLPLSFPFVEISTEDTFIAKDKNVLLAGYSAGFLGGVTIQKDLYMSSTIVQIKGVFTFKSKTIDLFSVGGSIVAQAGSSGGAVVDDRNKLLGIIVTSSGGDTTSERDLRALSLSHIDRSLVQNSSTSLAELLSGDLRTKAETFNLNAAPELTRLLENVLD